MTLFGADPRDEEISWLRSQVKFLQEQLVMIADQSAAARLLPRPDRKEPVKRTNWRFKEDRPVAPAAELTRMAAERAAEAAESFRDERQP